MNIELAKANLRIAELEKGIALHRDNHHAVDCSRAYAQIAELRKD